MKTSWGSKGGGGALQAPLAGSVAAPRKLLKNMPFLLTVSTILGHCRLSTQANREHSLLFVIAQKCIILLYNFVSVQYVLSVFILSEVSFMWF